MKICKYIPLTEHILNNFTIENDIVYDMLYELYTFHKVILPNKYIVENRANTNYLNRSVYKELIGKGSFNPNGYNFSSLDSFTTFVKMLRDTRYETFRIVYVKDNKVVGQDAVTSKIPGIAPISKHYKSLDDFSSEGVNRSLIEYRNKYDKLNADGYYLFHNHPTGTMRFSKEDDNVTDLFKQYVPGYVDHILIGINECMSYESGEVIELDNLETDTSKPITNSNMIKDVVHQYNNKPDYSTILYCDNQMHIKGIQEIKNTEFNDKNIWRWMAKEGNSIGGSRILFYTEDYDTFVKSGNGLVLHYLTDSVFLDKKTNTYINYRDYFGDMDYSVTKNYDDYYKYIKVYNK